MMRSLLRAAIPIAWACLASFLIADERPLEGPLNVFLDEPRMEMQQLFSTERFPNIVVTLDGTVLATWGSSNIRLRRSEDGGETWGREVAIAKPGFQGGGLTVDESSGDILAFVEAHHPPAPLTVYRSTDHGKSWQAETTVVNQDSNGNVPSMHMNEHGITLRHSDHKGRLLRPSRWYAGKNDRARWPQHYTNAIYSDDGGKTWSTSDPFPAFGTGEATVAELSDGRIYYNSRRHWAPEGANPRRRWAAWSENGGASWKDLSMCEVLPDGPQDTDYGCMGGLARLPVHGRDVLIYSNCDSPKGRHHGTVWASFDGGSTWPIKRLVFEGPFAYSSITSGRPNTKTAGRIYLHFEGGPQGASTIARFNLSWLLAGEKTGDGKLPGWLGKHAQVDNEATESNSPTTSNESREARDSKIAETVLLYQRNTGGWPKNYDRKQSFSDRQRQEAIADKSNIDSTIDNGATHTEILLLTEAYHATRDERFKVAILRGIDYLLNAQYDNGGWPQYFPKAKGYSKHITFNDNAMIGVMSLLQDIAHDGERFSFVPQDVRNRSAGAVARGIDCILKCQVTVHGQPTVWCAQHDEATFEPRRARSYELPSLSGSESVGIVRFLMQIDVPSEDVVQAVEAAVDWFERSKLNGIKLVRVEDEALPRGFDKVVIADPTAPPMWARFYDIETNKPIYCSRDGIPRRTLAEISYERRTGYSWLGYSAQQLLAKDLPAWNEKLGRASR